MTNFFYVLALATDADANCVKDKIYTAYMVESNEHDGTKKYKIINEVNRIITYKPNDFLFYFRILDIDELHSQKYVYNNLILKDVLKDNVLNGEKGEGEGGGGQNTNRAENPTKRKQDEIVENPFVAIAIVVVKKLFYFL